MKKYEDQRDQRNYFLPILQSTQINNRHSRGAFGLTAGETCLGGIRDCSGRCLGRSSTRQSLVGRPSSSLRWSHSTRAAPLMIVTWFIASASVGGETVGGCLHKKLSIRAEGHAQHTDKDNSVSRSA